ncbi:TonB-dependent siderophore receptor [Janthinobacterium sp. BJB1]|uniref:TonB-dependent siderophore receptor n=1 Tax=Janthinobacterium sp. GW458P TaxID=1981504 RepID=UPI000A328FEA|nr:TonB-dependent receptor [Janthinobacterium sp. GW458P]MBE3023531.1 TonB-dependent siderophore receptor [Janthinobacterium sp. GW458P]PJC97412.1 TonB-dependent siderophore receptor [Janthinobacterium sp. BJB1]
MWSPRLNLTPAPLALAAMLALGSIPLAQAQTAPTVKLAIAAQPLGQALNELARQANLQLLFAPDLVAGKTAPAVSATLSVRDGLERLLAGSGLQASMDGNAVIIKAAPKATGEAATLSEITVTANGERTAASEGTGAYTTRAVTLAGAERSLRDTPQSVSVVTRQQMDDKNLFTLDQVLEQSTGLTRMNRSFGSHEFLSRGNALSYLIDGMPGISDNATGWLIPDMAVYDRVEILRGSAGLIVGAGTPGGVANLVRKRPRAEAHADATATVGSWQQRRVELDAGAPLNGAGTVRGRALVAYEDRDYFYDAAHSRMPLFYGIVEADLDAATTVRAGARRQHTVTHGYWLFGLPRYSDGATLPVRRSTSLAQDWNRHDATIGELFADLEHRFGGDWKAKLAINRTYGAFDQQAAIVRGSINPATQQGARLYTVNYRKQDIVTTGLDANAAGSFQAWGGRHEVLLGMNASRALTDDHAASTSPGLPFDVFHPNNTLLAQPAHPAWDSLPHLNEQHYGAYASTRWELRPDLHLLLGGRLSWFDKQTTGKLATDPVSRYKESREFTPYAGLVHDLGKQWSVYGSYASIFQPQSLYYTLGGQPLKPVVGDTYEAGVKGELYDGRLNVALAAFRINKRDTAVYDEASNDDCLKWDVTGSCYRNGRPIRSTGIDADASGEVLPGWQLSSGYTYNIARGEGDETPPTVTPKHMLRLSTSYRLPGAWNHWTVGGGVSAQSGYVYRADDNPDVRFRNGGRTVWDVRASYVFNRNWSANLSIANVTDKAYWAATGELRRGNYFGEPRNLILTVRYTPTL